ncbi:MAG: CopD family protein [Gammaproteobacteria bacterium]|nr:CopD family protein [Gammaproteobacteria bacterium]
MLLARSLHIIFMVTWFAGLFYLPRLFIYHAETSDSISLERFRTMERRLFAIMTIGAILTIVFGASLLFIWLEPLLGQGWMQLKLVLIAGLIGYHGWCWQIMRAMRTNPQLHSATWLRWFNEIPGLFLVAVVLLAVFKPSL